MLLTVFESKGFVGLTDFDWMFGLQLGYTTGTVDSAEIIPNVILDPWNTFILYDMTRVTGLMELSSMHGQIGRWNNDWPSGNYFNNTGLGNKPRCWLCPNYQNVLMNLLANRSLQFNCYLTNEQSKYLRGKPAIK